MRQGVDNPVWRTDLAVHAAMRAEPLQASVLAQASARGGNWWGGSGVIWFGALLWLGGRALRRGAAARIGFRGIEALAVASAVSGITKGMAGRARPFVDAEPWHWEFMHGWTDARFFSMPSGHTTAATAFATGVILATRRWPPVRRAMIGVLALLSVVLVAWSRMYSNQHWLSDVLAGAILGAFAGLVLARVHANGATPAYDRITVGTGDGH